MWRKRCFTDWLAHPTSGSPPNVRANGFLQWDIDLPSSFGTCPHLNSYSSALHQVLVYATALLLRAYQISTILFSPVVGASVMAGSLPKFEVCIFRYSHQDSRDPGALPVIVLLAVVSKRCGMNLFPSNLDPTPEVLTHWSLDVTCYLGLIYSSFSTSSILMWRIVSILITGSYFFVIFFRFKKTSVTFVLS